MENLTPMMRQYVEIKEEYKDSILFFRLGDFYEMFYDDAVLASRELEITLTQRKSSGQKEGIPMAGVPHHVADTYIARLVDRGYKVAICEQVEDVSEAKGLVRRDVIKVVTPGTIMDSSVLDEKSNNYLMSIYMDNWGIGISYVDNSTGEMYTTEFSGDIVDSYRFVVDEIGKINPSEIICNEEFLEGRKYINIIENRVNPYFNVYNRKDIEEIEGLAIEKLFEESLEDLDIDKKFYVTVATEKLIEYLLETQKNSLEHINNLVYYKPQDYMIIDINTRANLELHETIISREKKGSLIHVLDKTATAMGGRMLRNWIEQPLLNELEINKRLNMVEYLSDDLMFLDNIYEDLRGIYDIERLASRVSTGNCNGRDLISLRNSLERIPGLKENLLSVENKELNTLGKSMDTLSDVHKLIDSSIKESPPISITEGKLIKEGFNEELDEIRKASIEGKEWLANLEKKERESTGINNLKVGYNKVAGYFIEVTKANTDKVPDYYTRRQTLTNSERYYTEELKEMESKILGAEEKTLDMEYKIFVEIRDDIKKEIKRLQYVSKLISKVDVLHSLAKVANDNNYTRPKINNKGSIDIKNGRHPVIETMIENELFVPNDTHLNREDSLIQIVTGPNMSGKSTYMRQVALISLMAQIGSFVPADAANLSIVDQIFTRIGASDNLSQGESTFMVEMNEVANIVREATSDSLIILDEVGRGTSTFDGVSIAWALVEYIAEEIKGKTLFATHYHELTQLEDSYDCIKNMTISAEEKGDDIVFLRKVEEGSTNKSYGIQVARLAGVNEDILRRADQVLASIEHTNAININEEELKKKEEEQISFADHRKDYFIENISKIDINEVAPIDAFNILDQLIKDAKNINE